ncbi:polyadenylation factor subunit 2 [Schistosoma bovis]|uniref:Polyadenylation factor subunit 2 n=1 Tax=Schistosoma bovis TaxID=6184 RepID=A0A430QQ33_SCHBO|nr:polyadenylation factor subunit 2 [Schistosoma bovis]
MLENLGMLDSPSGDSNALKKDVSDLMADARKSRKAVFRRTIDYNASAINYLQNRIWVSRDIDRPMLQPDYLWSPKAHESQIRCMKWSHNEEWLLTADHSGYVKYWQANMNNVEMYQAHKEPIRGVSFCPFDNKFVTCSDDSTVRIWDFHRCAEERVLRGHGSDVRSVAWHPVLSLIISGSKDAQQPIKLWDPKTGESVSTLYVHKNTCTDVSWNDNGNWFLTASRDHLIKLFDLRNLKSELQTFRGHKRDVMRVAWHPFHESLTDTELGAVDNAHESMIWSLAWHPFGHILVSGANDFATKFWTRNRPGDVLKDTISAVGPDNLVQAVSATNLLANTYSFGDPEVVDNSFNIDLFKLLTETPISSNRIDTLDDLAFSTNPNDLSTTEIPGLNEGPVTDLNITDTDDPEEREKNKLRSSRTIPKEFAANWASTRITAMPTVMMATPSPSAIAAAAAAAAAAVSNLNATPQYLPPVKPPALNKERLAQSAAPINPSEPEAIVDQIQDRGFCKPNQTPFVEQPISEMNNGVSTHKYDQPPFSEPLPPRVLEQHVPIPEHNVDLRNNTNPSLDWNQRNEELSLQTEHNAPLQTEQPNNLYREPFSGPPQLYNEQENFLESKPFPRHREDRDYRDHEHSEQFNRPFPENDHYYNGPPGGFNSGSYGHHNRNMIPNDQMHPGERGRPFSPNMEKYPYDRRGDRPPPMRQNYDEDSWGRRWPDNRNTPDRLDYPQGPPRRPPREHRPPHPDFYPDPRHPLPPNFVPPHKRPPPMGPGGQPPDHMRKYPRQDPSRSKPPWTGYNRW